MKKLLILSLLILPLNSVLASAIEDFNPVSHWTCDEASGVRYDSNTTNSNDLTDYNTTASITGILGDACDFEKTNSEYLGIADNIQSGLDVTTSASFSFWVNFESIPSSGVYTFLSKMGTAGNESFTLFLNSGIPNVLNLQGSGDGSYGGPGTYWTENWSPSTGVWYHLVFTYDGSLDRTTWYVDGTQLAQSTTAYTEGLFYDGTSRFEIGSDVGWNNGYFDGIIDEVTVFNTELSSSDVTILYNSGTPLGYEASTPPATSTPTSTVSVNMDDTNFLLAVIIFFVTFIFLGLAFSPVMRKK